METQVRWVQRWASSGQRHCAPCLAGGSSPWRGPRCSHWGVRGQNQCLMSARLSHHNTWELSPGPDHAWLTLAQWTLLVLSATLGLLIVVLSCQLHRLQTTWPSIAQAVALWCQHLADLRADQMTTACKTVARQHCLQTKARCFVPSEFVGSAVSAHIWTLNVFALLENQAKCRRWSALVTILTFPHPQVNLYCCWDCIALHLRSSPTHTVVFLTLKRPVHFYKLTTLQFACEKGRLQSIQCNCWFANYDDTLLWFMQREFCGLWNELLVCAKRQKTKPESAWVWGYRIPFGCCCCCSPSKPSRQSQR